MSRLTLDDVVNLPELDFEATRMIDSNVDRPFEYGQIAPVRGDEKLIMFEPETMVFGVYKDAKSGENYLVHSKSLRPHGGFPECSKFSNIHRYQSVRPYSKE